MLWPAPPAIPWLLLRKLKLSYIKIMEQVSAAKSLQSCPTLCDPIDGSPPGSPVPGILQARTLEWVAISFSNAWKWKVKGKSFSRVQPSATPWTAAYQAPLSMGFSRQEYWSGVPSPSWSKLLGLKSDSFNGVFLSLTYYMLLIVLGLWSAPQTLGMILHITITAVSLVCSMLSNTLSACLQSLIIKQMISLRLEHQRRNEANDQLKNCESEVMTCKQNSQQKTLWPVNNKQRVNKSCENCRNMTESSLQALKFDHTSQAGRHEQKGRIVKRQIKK